MKCIQIEKKKQNKIGPTGLGQAPSTLVFITLSINKLTHNNEMFKGIYTRLTYEVRH